MSRSPAILIALALTSSPAWAQDSGLGLDLTEDSTNKPQEETQDESTTQEATPPPAAPVETPSAEAAPAKPPEPQLTEGDITQEDRVKSVQRKVYLKRGRFELAPYVSVSINDPYYSKLGGFLRAGYYLADTLAIAGRFSLYQVLRSNDVNTAQQAFRSQIYYSKPQWSAIADVEWSPLYGKVAFLNSILHFDAYVLGGLGIVNTATAERVDLATGTKLGPAAAADLGAGLRFVAKDYLAINVSVINTAFVDQPTGTTKGAIQNVTTLNAGISIFFPFSSTGREAE